MRFFYKRYWNIVQKRNLYLESTFDDATCAVYNLSVMKAMILRKKIYVFLYTHF